MTDLPPNVRQHHARVLGELLLGRRRAGAERVAGRGQQAEGGAAGRAAEREGRQAEGGIKAEKAMEVAWRYTKEEIADWRAKQQEVLYDDADSAGEGKPRVLRADVGLGPSSYALK